CILSTVPNTLSKEKKALLETTAMMVGKMLEYSQFAFNTKENVHQLKQDRGTEKNMLSIVANHVLKPIESLKATVELCGYEGLDEEKLAV
ncbi:hypothetical protein ACSLVQ_28590, partial [Klebsiella pneumoniae]|uniref:hypothetical protein n=1 Tax=Klebsiella pneumoniae TaxID=573 RepID=UPI003EE3C6F5